MTHIQNHTSVIGIGTIVEIMKRIVKNVSPDEQRIQSKNYF